MGYYLLAFSGVVTNGIGPIPIYPWGFCVYCLLCFPVQSRRYTKKSKKKPYDTNRRSSTPGHQGTARSPTWTTQSSIRFLCVHPPAYDVDVCFASRHTHEPVDMNQRKGGNPTRVSEPPPQGADIFPLQTPAAETYRQRIARNRHADDVDQSDHIFATDAGALIEDTLPSPSTTQLDITSKAGLSCNYKNGEANRRACPRPPA